MGGKRGNGKGKGEGGREREGGGEEEGGGKGSVFLDNPQSDWERGREDFKTTEEFQSAN